MNKRDSQTANVSPGATPPSPGNARRPAAAVYLLLATFGVLLCLLSLHARTPALVWNFSESVPVGLYRIARTPPVKGELVAIKQAVAIREMRLAYGGHADDERLLLKRLAAVAGDVVCRSATRLSINGTFAATVRRTASNGGALPQWDGCRTLGSNEILVLARHPASFDSRYFGPVDRGQVVGVAHPVIVFPALQESL